MTKVTDEQKSELLKEWWDRDDVLTGLTTDEEHNKHIMFNVDRANKAIGTMLSDLKAVEQDDELEILHRQEVPANIRMSDDDSIYKFRTTNKSGGAMRANYIKDFLLGERKKAQGYVTVLKLMADSGSPELRKIAVTELKKVLGSFKEVNAEGKQFAARKTASFLKTKMEGALTRKKASGLTAKDKNDVVSNTKLFTKFCKMLRI